MHATIVLAASANKYATANTVTTFPVDNFINNLYSETNTDAPVWAYLIASPATTLS